MLNVVRTVKRLAFLRTQCPQYLFDSNARVIMRGKVFALFAQAQRQTEMFSRSVEIAAGRKGRDRQRGSF